MLARIAVVDDDEHFLDLMRRLVSRKKIIADICFFSEGKDFLDAASDQASKCFDFVFVDINLPLFDGIDLLEGLISKGRIASDHCAVLSSFSTDDQKTRCKKIGIREVIDKPLTFKVFEKVIEETDGLFWEFSDEEKEVHTAA